MHVFSTNGAEALISTYERMKLGSYFISTHKLIKTDQELAKLLEENRVKLMTLYLAEIPEIRHQRHKTTKNTEIN